MKYKVGDKVRVKNNLQDDVFYGKVPYAKTMEKYKGEVLTIDSISKEYYFVKEDYGKFKWTDEMLEPIEEMSVEEAIKLSGKLCSGSICDECPVFKARKKYSEGCNVFKKEHTEEYLEILKKWKADHEKKPIQTENAWFILIMDTNRKIVHEEKLDVPCDGTFNLDYEQRVALKRYCNEHDGKFIAVREFRSVVKE